MQNGSARNDSMIRCVDYIFNAFFSLIILSQKLIRLRDDQFKTTQSDDNPDMKNHQRKVAAYYL